jgi:hypothetical protein
VKQTVDHVKGGYFRISPLVGQVRQQIRQRKDIADVLFKLAQLAA